MTDRGFYSRMARQGIVKNARYYIPYFISCIGCAAMFYIMLYLNGNRAVGGMIGGAFVASILGLGAIIIAIFSMLILAYTNSFLMKRRERELGLYNILGMEKRHIARVLFWESAYSAVIGIAGGLLMGILLSKLLLLILCALLRFDVPFGFEVAPAALWYTAVVFCVIFFLNLLTNLRRVGFSKPLELLHSSNLGEREPKTKWLLTLIGIIFLGGGYGIAVVVESPINALALFFVAVLLVILGTYCLFISGSIAVLKMLRANRGYYYKTAHFTAVSGLLFRMKRNAAGLASICILSTMVLVTVSSTLCLYMGSEEVLAERYPSDISLTFRKPGEGTRDAAIEDIRRVTAAEGLAAQNISVYEAMDIYLAMENGAIVWRGANESDGYRVICDFVSEESYAAANGLDMTLTPGRALIQTRSMDFELGDTVNVLGMEFKVSKVPDVAMLRDAALVSYVGPTVAMVLCPEDLYALRDAYVALNPDDKGAALKMEIGFDVDAPDEKQLEIADRLWDIIGANEGERYQFSSCTKTTRAENVEEYYALYGGFFFLGIFLGLLFLMATALIIYYKQLSEGYEDAGRFKIMQQVGMSRREVKSSIHSQIVTVFFLPLAAAGVHIAFAFRMITRLLTLFGLYNVGLFALCCLGAFLVFALVYLAIYALTARAYYRIVHT
ncbi:MAG: FtsX-like permease family protein [Butyricicoccus sp.]|nr:FtsX-like permease family protein [Butyricicoccus sp.]